MHATRTIGMTLAAALLAATVAVAQTGGAAGAGADGDDGAASGGIGADDDLETGAPGTGNDAAVRGTPRGGSGASDSAEPQYSPEDDRGETNDDAGPSD